MLHGLGSGGGLQQGHSAAAKATAGHAAAINPGGRQRGLHELVQLGTAHLIVIPAEETDERAGLAPAHPAPGLSLCLGYTGTSGSPPERVVTLHHEAAEGSVVSPAQGSRRLGRALDLTHNVPCAPEALLAHQVSASWGGKGVSGPTTHHLCTPADVGVGAPRRWPAGGRLGVGDLVPTKL